MPPIEPELEHQKIRNRGLLEDLDFEPESPRTFWTNNLFTRTITRLVGKGLRNFIHIKATETGALKVAEVGGGTTAYVVYAKTAFSSDAYVNVNFGKVYGRIDITTWDFDVKIKLSYDGVNYGDAIVINANTFYSIEHGVFSLQVANNTPGSNATLQIAGFI